jgi:hypothetical protein
MSSTSSLSPELVRAARSEACKFFDGEISSADAAAVFARIARSGWHGEPLNALHAEFDAAVDRLIEDQTSRDRSPAMTSTTTYPGLSVHSGENGYFIAHGFRKAEHKDPETFRISPYYGDGAAAERAWREKSAEYLEHIPGHVMDILRRDNVTEPGGEWSVYDVARILDPAAPNPESMFDTGRGGPTPEWVALAERIIGEIKPPARYVGGTSKYLYHL